MRRIMAGIARRGNDMQEPEQGITTGDDAMSLNTGSRVVIRRIFLVCGAITAGPGALVLVGWALASPPSCSSTRTAASCWFPRWPPLRSWWGSPW